MRVAACVVTAAILLASAPALAQSALQRPDDGINQPELRDDPMLDRPLTLYSAKPAKPKPAPVVSSAPNAVRTPKKPASFSPSQSAKPAAVKPARVNFRQCADSYFAGANLLRQHPDAVDTLLQRAQQAGERHLQDDPSQDKSQLVLAIKQNGNARAAEIRALDDAEARKAAEALFRVIRTCDAALHVEITPPLVFNAPPGPRAPPAHN